MREVLGQIAGIVQPETGAMMRFEGFIFISSPRAATPLHFDPEYNILFLGAGAKTMILFPAADPRLSAKNFSKPISPRERVTCRGRMNGMRGRARFRSSQIKRSTSRSWRRTGCGLMKRFRSRYHSPGGATWSFHHDYDCRFNRRLRKIGLRPAAPRLYPANNRLKSYAYRALARVEKVLPAG